MTAVPVWAQLVYLACAVGFILAGSVSGAGPLPHSGGKSDTSPEERPGTKR